MILAVRLIIPFGPTRFVKHCLGSEFSFRANSQGITRMFDLAQHKRSGPEVVFGTDASPYGLGGWIAVDGHIQHYFSCAISSHDEEIYGVASGTCIGQQIWECLAVLVALRLWWAIIRKYRCNIAVRLDNVGALSLVRELRPHGTAQTIIARELALLFDR